ncbi:hypothetical protein GIB67_029180 [Kingdonia uniflora]|uniref:Uncharacterized protein n=1 Tax=Kingdonia uniflora TaxID=39325 RepID=A0A7J7LRX8_9MAGN|nr:hypothetical protein GIB67_029180 [Kingdonia uniflora]
MDSSFVNKVSTSGRTNEYDNEGEVRLEQFSGFPGQLISYPPGSDAFREFCKAKATVAIPGIGSSAQPNPVKPRKVPQKYLKKRMLKALPASGITGSGEVTKDKRRRVEPSRKSGEKVTGGRSASIDDLKEVEEKARLAVLQREEDTKKIVSCSSCQGDMTRYRGRKKWRQRPILTRWSVEERDRLGRHLMLKGYSEEEVDVIKADTYVEEEDEEEAEALGTVDGLDGVSLQKVLDNQGDDVELPEGGSEKVVREMSLRINNLESGLARERETFKALLSAQAELQVKLDLSRSREDNVLMCNQEFAEQFDRMKEANENREDQYIKAHFRLMKLIQTVFDLTLQVEEKDVKINKGLTELAEVTERAEKLQRQVDTLAMKAEHLQTALPAKDMVFREMQRRYNDLNERVTRLKAELVQAIARVKKTETREHSGGGRTEGNVQKGNTNLRECQHKLDAVLIREKVLEGEIKAKESLVKRKEELLKDLCICGAKIDRGNCLGTMETQLGPRTAESIEQGRAVVACELKARPLDVWGIIADTPSAEWNPL